MLVWLLGVVDSCTACSKGLGSLLWGYVATSIVWGVGPSFHAFNESRPPCMHELDVRKLAPARSVELDDWAWQVVYRSSACHWLFLLLHTLCVVSCHLAGYSITDAHI